MSRTTAPAINPASTIPPAINMAVLLLLTVCEVPTGYGVSGTGVGGLATTAGGAVGDGDGSGEAGETGETGDWYQAHTPVPGGDNTQAMLAASNARKNNISPGLAGQSFRTDRSFIADNPTRRGVPIKT
jgi:hypothetical protein